ncbi:hypothetical protein FK530_23020 [Tsukamurella conjunctivitidis]|uniref:Uncharacterized protein n=1 Tax=Tsukamurella conjunctivitidis TaxID=2592068 RepID=A0A5C5RS57_9ACTN|nr:hypothetical protein [Tsukamurella conjunctivitidis]TWS25594.1 hypothetical protein FK530_23020 [Tsukamurella conjunctivitidis]
MTDSLYIVRRRDAFSGVYLRLMQGDHLLATYHIRELGTALATGRAVSEKVGAKFEGLVNR